MPLEIRAIRERTKTCTIELGEGASLNMDYYPAKAADLDSETIKEMAAKNAGMSKRDQRRELAALFCSIVTSWDVTSGGVPFPLEPDAIADEPAFDDIFLAVCIGALYQDAQTPKPNGELTSVLGTVGTLPKAGAVSSPVLMDSRKKSNTPKSRSKTA